MSKNVIFVASDAGNIGKTFIASLILETLRLYSTVGAYVCDSKFQGLYERYGMKGKDGIVLPFPKQDANKGVGFLDISNPSEKEKFATYLKNSSDFMLFDLPANSTMALASTMGTPQDFLDFMEFDDAKPIFVCPIKDEKSITSYLKLKEIFPNERFVVFINGGAIKATHGLNEKKAMEEIATLKKQFIGDDVFCLEHVVSDRAFELLKDHTFREVFVPRSERKNNDGTYSATDDDFLAKDRGDQFVFNRLIPEATEKIRKIFL